MSAADFASRVASIYTRHRGSSPASIVQNASKALFLIVGVIESDPDSVATETMVSQMLEVCDLLDAVYDELAGDKLTEDERFEFNVGARYAGASPEARRIGEELVRTGQRHDRFMWAALFRTIQTSLLSDDASRTLEPEAERLRAVESDTISAAAEE